MMDDAAARSDVERMERDRRRHARTLPVRMGLSLLLGGSVGLAFGLLDGWSKLALGLVVIAVAAYVFVQLRPQRCAMCTSRRTIPFPMGPVRLAQWWDLRPPKANDSVWVCNNHWEVYLMSRARTRYATPMDDE